MRPFVTGATLQPVLEAFALVADALADRGKKKARPKELSETAMERGRERLESGQLVSPDALSSATFDGAIGLAANRELLERSHDVASRRMAFRDEVDGYDAVATDLRRSTIPTQR